MDCCGCCWHEVCSQIGDSAVIFGLVQQQSTAKNKVRSGERKKCLSILCPFSLHFFSCDYTCLLIAPKSLARGFFGFTLIGSNAPELRLFAAEGEEGRLVEGLPPVHRGE